MRPSRLRSAHTGPALRAGAAGGSDAVLEPVTVLQPAATREPVNTHPSAGTLQPAGAAEPTGPPHATGLDLIGAGATLVGASLTTVAERLHLPFAKDARAMLRRNEVRADPIWQDPPLAADGLPVLLVGGMNATPAILQTLRDWLRRLGCYTQTAPTRLGTGCGEHGAQVVTDALHRLADRAGAAPVVIAHSRGGQFARAAAVRDPELVRGLITLGSPLNRLTGVHPLLRLEIYALGAIGTLGVPGLFGAACLWGHCCRRLRGEIAGPFPADVPFLSVYSRQDEMVAWRSSLDPFARHAEVATSHGGLVADPDAFGVIAAELAALLADSGGGSGGGTDDGPEAVSAA